MDNQQVKLDKRFTISDDNYIKANYIFRDNNSVTKIANALGTKRRFIEDRITQLGINPWKRFNDCSMLIKTPNIDTAFILGVYLSDAWTHKDAFELHSIDKDYCEATVSALSKIMDGEFNKNIRFYEADHLNKNKKSAKYTTGQYRIRVRSSDLCTWLMTVTESKQIIPQNFLDSNEEILKSLLDGAMSGDGWIGTSKRDCHVYGGWEIGLCGHSYIYKAVNQYATIFDKLNIRYKITHPSNESVGFVTYKINKDDFIDSGCKLSIKRKQDKLEIVKSLRVTSTSIMEHPEMDDGVL